MWQDDWEIWAAKLCQNNIFGNVIHIQFLQTAIFNTNIITMGEKMDRGTDALKTNVSSISKMDVRQVSACVCVCEESSIAL